jgi:exodeoxyribonuclease VII large subunit
MRGRHAADLAHQLRRAGTLQIARRERLFRGLAQRLEARDLRRRFATLRGRLAAADTRLSAAAARAHDRAGRRLTDVSARLDTLSPLAVLARGYAVCWNADRTAIVRRAADTRPGDRVHVTLHDGEIECDVRRN